MEEKNQLDALKFVSQTHRSLHEQRRKYELQILVTVLTFYVLSVAVKFSGEVVILSCSIISPIIWVSFTMLAIVTSAFLLRVHKANRTNMGVAEQVEDQLLYSFGIKCRLPPRGRFYCYLGWLWQTVLLFMFAIVSAFLLTHEIWGK